MSPLHPFLPKALRTARPLRSAGIAPLPRHYGPIRHRLAVSRFPVLSGYTAYPTPTISRWDEDGFSSCSTCPCHRAVPHHPAGVTSRIGHPTSCHAMLPTPRKRGLGLRTCFVSRPPLGLLALRPSDSLATPRMALSVGFIRFVSSAAATQAKGLLALTPVGLTPTEHVSLRWTHSFAKARSGS